MVCDTTRNTVRQGYCYTCLAIGGGISVRSLSGYGFGLRRAPHETCQRKTCKTKPHQHFENQQRQDMKVPKRGQSHAAIRVQQNLAIRGSNVHSVDRRHRAKVVRCGSGMARVRLADLSGPKWSILVSRMLKSGSE